MATDTHCPRYGSSALIYDSIRDGADFMMHNAKGWADNAAGLASALQSFTVDKVEYDIDDVLSSIVIGPFVYPERPAPYAEPPLSNANQPPLPALYPVDTSGLSVPLPSDPPALPNVSIPSAPTLNELGPLPVSPLITIPDSPVYDGPALPLVPTLQELDIPDAPTIEFTEYDVERPDFDALIPPLFENRYYEDVDAQKLAALNEFDTRNSDGAAVRARWSDMLLGGTGLPVPIEQALFDRAVMREELSSLQAVNQAEQEWAAKGFALPGSTLLARVSEIHNANRAARAQINREITVQYHTQEIENLRFAVQQGVTLEGQAFDQYIRVYDTSRQVVEGFYTVARSLLDAQIAVLQAHISTYQADIQAARDRIQIELAKLEVYRGQLEAQRLIGDINKLEVDIYQAQLQGILAAVEVFKAEIEGVNSQIRGELAKVEVFKAQLDAYTTGIEVNKSQVDLYKARIDAESSKTNLYEAEVRGFVATINAYSARIQAESTKVNAGLQVNDSLLKQYQTQIEAWRTTMQVDFERIKSAIAVLEANVDVYKSDIVAETSRVQADTTAAGFSVQVVQANLAAKLKQADQDIEQMRHATSLAVASLEGAARTYSQLSASALSAVNLSTGLSHSTGNSNSSSCSTSYNYSGEI